MPRLSEALEGQREDVLYFVHSSVQKSFTGLYTADLRESSCWPKTFMKKNRNISIRTVMFQRRLAFPSAVIHRGQYGSVLGLPCFQVQTGNPEARSEQQGDSALNRAVSLTKDRTLVKSRLEI